MGDAKQRLRNGETLHGCWLNLGSSVTAEIVGRSGFDWVLIDLEHGAGTEKDVLYQLQALGNTPAVPVVRVESVARQRLHRVLDLGAEGIMCPRINDLNEAREAVAALRYPPAGKRGVAKMVRATGFGDRFQDYYEQSDDHLLGIIQIETVEVLGHLDEIAALDGVDVLFVGPSDLSMALGMHGQFDQPAFVDAIERTIGAAEANGKTAGILLRGPDEYVKYRRMGMRMIACGADAAFVALGARTLTDTLHGYRDAFEKGL